MTSFVAWPGRLMAAGTRLSAAPHAWRIGRAAILAVLALSAVRILGLG
jgi:hypothetical protein